MVPEETWQKLVPPKRRADVVLDRIFTTTNGILISDSRIRYACAATFRGDDADTAMIWGYYPGTFTTGDLEKSSRGPEAPRSPTSSASRRPPPVTSARVTRTASSARPASS